MKILTVSFFDDNFGDMLVRVCFDRLLIVAMKNLGFDERELSVENMHIKEIDAEKVAGADLILFSGGAMFGFNNLGSFDAIDTVTSIADEKNIPVVFSSMGMNHINANEESENRLNAILRRKCVKAMSVRESTEIFAPYADGCSYEIVSVCDPAVWSKHVYRKEVQEVRNAKQGKVVGLNIVRGGLFKANGKKWTLDTEEQFIKNLIALYDEKGIDYRLYTNGSILDCNSMGYIARRIGVPDEKVICPDSARELVRAIAGFDAMIAIRMHSGIVSYALDVPSIDLVWNDKIPHFYNSIGYPDRAVELQYCTPEVILRMTEELLADSGFKADEEYLMTLYRFLYTTLGNILKKSADDPYGFAEISHLMGMQESGITDDVMDYRTKLHRAHYCYRALFDADMERRRQLRSLKKQVKQLSDQLEEYKQKYEGLEQESEQTRQELGKINRFLPMRIYRKLFKKK